jgi:hypothetical protein
MQGMSACEGTPSPLADRGTSVTAHAGMAVPEEGAATPAAMAAAMKDCRFLASGLPSSPMDAPTETASLAMDCGDDSEPKGNDATMVCCCTAAPEEPSAGVWKSGSPPYGYGAQFAEYTTAPPPALHGRSCAYALASSADSLP